LKIRTFSVMKSREISLRAAGNREQQLKDVFQVEQGPILGSQRGLELVQAVTENLDVRPRRHGEHRVVVVNREASVGELYAQLSPVEDNTVLVTEQRQEHLVGELGLYRHPVDVEE
jgi:hypothetical protein